LRCPPLTPRIWSDPIRVSAHTCIKPHHQTGCAGQQQQENADLQGGKHSIHYTNTANANPEVHREE